jgi:hypothetical protein
MNANEMLATLPEGWVEGIAYSLEEEARVSASYIGAERLPPRRPGASRLA